MKTGILFLLLLPFTCLAQEKNCVIEAKEIDSLVKVANYAKAYQIWETSGCISESHYLNGEKILIYQLSTPVAGTERNAYIASLLKLYADDDKNFPGNKHGNLVKRAKAMQQYQSGTPEEIFNLYDKAFKDDRDNFTDARGLYEYFGSYFAKFKIERKNFTEGDLIEKQDDILGWMNDLIVRNEAERRNYQTAIDGIKVQTNDMLTCDVIEAYYEKQYPSKIKDARWLAQAADHLISKNCLSTETVSKVTSAWYALQPDARSAYAMGVVSLRSKGDQKSALNYFNEAVEKEKDAIRKSETLMVIASLYTSTDVPKAIGFVKKAMALRPDSGKPYFLLAQLYVSTDCGKTPFEKKALYKLAADTATKAGVVDLSMKSSAEIVSAKYLKKAPTKEEIKEAKLDGKTFSFGCGINQSVTFPK